MAWYATRAPHGGLALGLSLAGRGVWLERQPLCHRWRLLRSRIPCAPLGGHGDAPPDVGVREPRTPRPGTGSGHITLDPPRS
jgi:hypothetical protein